VKVHLMIQSVWTIEAVFFTSVLYLKELNIGLSLPLKNKDIAYWRLIRDKLYCADTGIDNVHMSRRHTATPCQPPPGFYSKNRINAGQILVIASDDQLTIMSCRCKQRQIIMHSMYVPFPRTVQTICPVRSIIR